MGLARITHRTSTVKLKSMEKHAKGIGKAWIKHENNAVT
jgi:hypothetical protein